MRFPRLRRRRTPKTAPTITMLTPSITGNTASLVHAIEWHNRTASPQFPVSTQARKEAPMSDVQRKLYRHALKREARTAGQLAARAGLSASDGSGRGVVKDLNGLVSLGLLVRHGSRTPYGYTRAGA